MRAPTLLPAYPGLDAGRHGHWGTHDQNSHGDMRWNEIAREPVPALAFRTGETRNPAGALVMLQTDEALTAADDTAPSRRSG